MSDKKHTREVESVSTAIIWQSFASNTLGSQATWRQSFDDFPMNFTPDEIKIKLITYSAPNADTADNTFLIFCQQLGGYLGSFSKNTSVNVDIHQQIYKKISGLYNFEIRKVGAVNTVSPQMVVGIANPVGGGVDNVLNGKLCVIVDFVKYAIKQDLAPGNEKTIVDSAPKRLY